MPFIRVTTTAHLPPERHTILLEQLSRLLAEHTGKPEQYVMTHLAMSAPMTFAGTTEPVALVEIKSIGTFTPAQTRAMSEVFCDVIRDTLHVPVDRIYLEFVEAERHLWGWNRRNFAD